MKTREVILLIGPPGVGKSTWLKNAGLYQHAVCSTDNIFVEKGAELGMTYNEAFHHFSFKEVEAAFKAKMKACAEQGESVVIDRTNLTKKGRAKVLEYFPSYHVVYVLFDFSNKAALEARVQKRGVEEGKTISQKVMDEMYAKYQEPSSDEYDEIIYINNFN